MISSISKLWLEVDDSHPKMIEDLVVSNDDYDLTYVKTLYDFRERFL